MKRHVVIAVPAYAGTVHIGTMRSLLTDILSLARSGTAVSMDDECGNTNIADARATMVHRFLETSGTDLVFVDNDVMWQAGSIQRLLDHPVEVVGGIYPKRKDPVEFPVRYADGAGPILDQQTGLLEMGGLSGGFVRWRRSALEKLVAAHQDLNFEVDGKRVCGLFDPYRAGEMKLSEDYAICQRWRDLGGKVWLDPGINMGHAGLKIFVGKFGEFTEKQEAA